MTASQTKRPVKVAIVVPEPLPGRGGIARVVAYQTEYMASNYSDITPHIVLSRYGEGRILRHLSTPLALSAFCFSLLWHRIQIVHINVAPRGSTWRKMLYAALARRLGCKVVLHLHGSGYNEFFAELDTRRKAVARLFFHRAHKVIALSPFWKRFLETELHLGEGSIVVVPNGVPAPMVVKAGQSLAARPPVILFLGVIGRRKGVDVLISAFAELRKRGVRFTALLGGNGEVKKMEALALKLGLSEVSFLGWTEEVSPLLESSDIFVLPSRAENQPVSILEAMAHAVPVIATSVGAIPEQVVDGQTGFLVPPGEVTPLADALQKLIEAPALRQSFGNSGHRRFQTEFSVATSAERIVDVYRKLAASVHSA